LLLLRFIACADESLMAAAKYSSQYISDRFLPDKAIDLIDEAGSRVRLRHIQLPEEARDLDKELKQVRWMAVTPKRMLLGLALQSAALA
jgi:ATP-dependent Clp protease ATP-binding subunit ClpA